MEQVLGKSWRFGFLEGETSIVNGLKVLVDKEIKGVMTKNWIMNLLEGETSTVGRLKVLVE